MDSFEKTFHTLPKTLATHFKSTLVRVDPTKQNVAVPLREVLGRGVVP